MQEGCSKQREQYVQRPEVGRAGWRNKCRASGWSTAVEGLGVELCRCRGIQYLINLVMLETHPASTSLSDLAVLRGAPLGSGSHSSQHSDLCWLPTYQGTELSHIPPLVLGKCPPPIFKKLFFPLSMELDGLE